MPRVSRRSEGFIQYHFTNTRIHAFTSTRKFNARFEEEAPGERLGLTQALKLNPEFLVGAEQTHGTDIQIVDKTEAGRGSIHKTNAYQGVDGFITVSPEVALSVKTADCLPLFLVDSKMPALCLIHSGWKGAKNGIAEKGVALLWKLYGIEPSGLEAILGPVIRYEDYEVGDNFQTFFPGFVTRPTLESKFHFDLPGYVKKRLVESGLKEENILDTGLSTVREPQDFFSYRREGASAGRMLSLLWMEN
jgi:YfiH family protein